MTTNVTETRGMGVVVKKNMGVYHVRENGRVLPCILSSKLRKELIYSAENPNAPRRVEAVDVNNKTDPIAVGDHVKYTDFQDGSGIITENMPRRNRLSRLDPAPGKYKFEQVLAANVDFIVPIFAAANPIPKWGLLDRYLASAESFSVASVIVISKIDLLEEMDPAIRTEVLERVDEYRAIGYPVVLTSSRTGQGLNELCQILQGHVSVFAGKSGVGKSALLMALEPGLKLRVGEVGKGHVGKGRHTTTGAEMISLSFGGDIIDTPGVREFGLFAVDEEELVRFFPEMRSYQGRCKFGLGCRHEEEPGCAIRRAVMEGHISPRRYQSYIRLKEEL